MWFYGYGWWWWWVLFLIIFFLLPLGYGWGYRGWGPWYRRRRSPELRDEGLPPAADRRSPTDPELDTGWGWAAVFLWIVLILAIIWLVVALGWGGRWR